MSLLSDNLTNSSVPATISIAGPGFTNQETLRAICDCASCASLPSCLHRTRRRGLTKTHRMKCATAFVICTYSHRIHRIHPPIHPPIPCVRSPPSSPPSCHEHVKEHTPPPPHCNPSTLLPPFRPHRRRVTKTLSIRSLGNEGGKWYRFRASRIMSCVVSSTRRFRTFERG
jgi:hypothetical protein